MKKCFAMLLAALMLLGCGLAVAEEQHDEVSMDEDAV